MFRFYLSRSYKVKISVNLRKRIFNFAINLNILLKMHGIDWSWKNNIFCLICSFVKVQDVGVKISKVSITGLERMSSCPPVLTCYIFKQKHKLGRTTFLWPPINQVSSAFKGCIGLFNIWWLTLNCRYCLFLNLYAPELPLLFFSQVVLTSSTQYSLLQNY